jgi:hypothetical protein
MDTRRSACAAPAALLVALVMCAACSREPAALAEADYAAVIPGQWMGTVGDSRERLSLGTDGRFDCDLRSTGFLANTLSQGVAGSVHGAWRIAGRKITLIVTGEKNERVENTVATGTIVSLRPDALVMRSDRGETTTFQRVRAL